MSIWPTFKSEVRKLLSVRSTYILILAALALVTLFAFVGTSASTYEEAVCSSTGEVLYSLDEVSPKLENATPEEVCKGPVSYNIVSLPDLPYNKILFNVQETVPLVALFLALVLVLQMAHEFRYNTITHTLTLSNSRSKVLLSKVGLSILFVTIVTLAAIGLCVAVSQLAINIKNLNAPAQDFSWLYVIGRHLGYVLGFTLFWMAIITLVRNLTAGIAAIFILPTIEQIGVYFLSQRNIEPTKTLFFSALDRFGAVASDITQIENIPEFITRTDSGPASVIGAGLVVLAYLVGLWAVAWWLFVRRDATN